MATATDTAPVETHDDHDAHHPSDWEYIKIAIILAVLTAIEVGMYFLEGKTSEAVIFIGLTVLMIIKFVLVVAYFMHLKYDTKFNIFIFLAAFWFGGSFFLFTFIDLTSRGDILKIQNIHELRSESAEGL